MQYLLATITIALALLIQAHATAAPLEEFIEAELRASALPGVSYAIVSEDTITASAHGVTDLRTGAPVTADTPFAIGSISKSFTATAILQLVEAGRVELDAPMANYLDVFADRPSGAITIRQLLSHTSGFSTRQGNDTPPAQGEDAGALSQHVARMAQGSPAFPPGSRWDYSNANYMLLGAVIEAESGLKFETYIDANILEPLKMTNSSVGNRDSGAAMATGHTPWFGGKRAVRDGKASRAILPAGGVVASANDLALYLEMLLNQRDDIISAEHKALMLRPASPQSPFYGLCWSLNPQDGVAYHTGTSPGTETIAILIPAERKAVTVLVNAGSGMGFGETRNLIDGISAQALGWDFTPDQSQWGRVSLFLMFVLLPLLFVAGTVQAWFGRSGLRQKSGAFGAFSLWLPLLMTAALAWTTISLIPGLFGVSLRTLAVYSPDFSLALLATAVSGLLWAVFRLGVYYWAKRPEPNGARGRI